MHTKLLRAEPHTQIAVVIERDADRLVDAWCRRAMVEHSAANRVHFEQLRDHLPHFLRAMAMALRQAGNPEPQLLCVYATDHGEERWQSGWSLTEVIRDYQLLRLVLLQHLEEALGRPLRSREAMAVGVFIDDAVAASVARYVATRDEEAGFIERQRLAALETMNRHKDEFIAVLGHELRNPLAPIQTSLRILQSVLAAPPPPAQHALEVIERQSRLMTRLVDDMLDLARIGQGRFELRREEVSLATLMERAVQVTDGFIRVQGRTLSVSYPPEPIILDADPERVVQVISNLLNNAAKYTEPRGHIWLTGESDGVCALVRVRDDGMGITPAMLHRVFDLFAQGENARHNARGGMGIGLALVKRLVEQHGGSVACSSDGAGRGTEFVVRLPLKSPEPLLPAQPDTAATAAGGVPFIGLIAKEKPASGGGGGTP
jgi:signal transduction histidine kinase